MKIVENLAALALRQIFDGPRPPEQIRQLFASQGERMRQALTFAAHLAWRGLELAVAGKSGWDACQGRLRPGDEPMAAQMRAFLDAPAFGDFSALSPELRSQAWRQLRAVRHEGNLGDVGADLGWLDGALAPDAPGQPAQWRVVEKTAAELGPAFPALPELFAVKLPDGQPPLARAAGLCFRRVVETDSELSVAPALLNLPPLPQTDRTAMEALFDVLTQRADQLETLYSGPLGDDEPRPLFDIEAETRELPEPWRHLGRLTARALRRHRLHAAPGLLDGVAISADTDRQRVKDLAARVHALPAEQQRKLPGLMHGLGLLEAAAGQFDAAERDLQTAAAAVTNPPVQGLLCQAVGHVALEAHHWPVALEHLQRAAALDPRTLALFPAEKFEPERVLGCDPSGLALLCKHRASGNRVVVRPLWPEGLAANVADVFRESRLLEDVDHPGMVRLRDADFADAARSRPYLVTDYFEGLTLAEYVRQNGPIPAPEMLKIARIVAELLQAAHERKVLHRDLKPTNILVRKDGATWRVKVCNFGMALRPSVLFAALGGAPVWGRTIAGQGMLTTLPYLAPEQLGVVEELAPGPYSDVYSFGRVCYFGLLGTPEPDDEEKEDLPNSWRKLLGQCVARNLDRRLTGFQAILKRIGTSSATTAEPEPAPAPPTAPAPAPAPARPAADRTVLENYVNRGMAFKQQGNTDRALAAFTKALQLDPNHLPAYFKRGNTYLDRADYDRAIADYTQALRLDPNNPSAYMNRGLAHAKKGNFDAVINDCSEAVRLDPKLAQAYSIRAAAYWERGERHRAIADYSLALRCDPKNALAYNGRGLAFAEEGDYDRAIADYTQALRCEPRLGVGYLNRGTAYRAKNQLDQALGDYNKALRLEPRNVMGYYCRALAHMARHAYDDALSDLNKALTLDPRHAEAAQRREEVMRARTRAAAGAPTPAAPGPGKVPAPSGTGTMAPPKVKPPRRRTQVVVPAAPKIVPKTPSEQAEEERRQMRAAAYFASGKTAYEQEKYKEAIEQFGKALQVDPKDAQLYFHRGLAHVAQDDFAEALTDFTESIRLNPKNALAHYQCGLTHRLLGQHEQAIEDYSRALKLDPRLALAYRNRSLAYAARGDTEKARADYERALRLDPSLAKDE